ncbi:MAG: chromate resistance protein [Sporichthyaceae bacterium]|nr:chromate resistance protein [Sporichthyaceae bacterium]
MATVETPRPPGEWVLLSYHLPREPSTPRISLWRRLKRLGVAQLSDGLVALPADARTTEQLEWVAEEVLEAGGTAGVWLARATTTAQEHALAAGMAEARAAEYLELTTAASAASSVEDVARGRTLQRLRGQWREITRRDFFPPPERDEAWAALRVLGDVTEPADGRPTRGPGPDQPILASGRRR